MNVKIQVCYKKEFEEYKKTLVHTLKYIGILFQNSQTSSQESFSIFRIQQKRSENFFATNKEHVNWKPVCQIAPTLG